MFDFRKNHILQAILFLLLLLLAYILRSVLIVIFVAFLITTVIHPIVNWLHKRHVPTGLAVLLPIVGLIIVFGLLGYFVVPQIASEIGRFASQIPNYLSRLQQHGINFHINIDSLKNVLQTHFGAISDVLFSATRTAIEVVIAIISIFVITLYWLGSYDRVQKTLISFVPQALRSRFRDVWSRVEKKLVNWMIAQILLGITVGVLTWIGALIIGLPFAGVLGVLAGLLEIIPTLGPIASAIPGILLGFTISPGTALAALIMYVIVQQSEAHLLTPVLLGKTVRLSPIIVIMSLLIGAVLLGILGALLAVPVALVVSAVVDSFRDDSDGEVADRASTPRV